MRYPVIEKKKKNQILDIQHSDFVMTKSPDGMPKTLGQPHYIYFYLLDVQKEDRNTTGVTKNQHCGDTVLQKDSLNN